MTLAERSFQRGLEDTAASLRLKVSAFDQLSQAAPHALELLGLGTLAAPSVYEIATGNKVSPTTAHLAELGGLGILAAHPAHELYHSLTGASPKMGQPPPTATR